MSQIWNKTSNEGYFGIGYFCPVGNPSDYPEYREAYKRKERVLKDISSLKQAGFRWTRTHFDWSDIQPTKGEWNLEWLDWFVQAAYENGIGINAVLCYCPDWAGQRWNLPPDNVEDYANFVQCLVRRYKQWVRVWEIWNEANVDFYWKGSQEQYVELLKAAYKAAKRADQTCQVMLTGLAGRPETAPSLRRLLELGAGDFADIIAFHPYSANDIEQPEYLPDVIEGTRKVAVEFGSRWPLWINELTWNTHDISVTEVGQAHRLVKSLVYIKAKEYIAKTLLTSLRDIEHAHVPKGFCEAENYCGIVRTDGTPKLAYYACRTIMDLLSGNTKLITDISIDGTYNPSALKLYAFEKGGDCITMSAWNTHFYNWAEIDAEVPCKASLRPYTVDLFEGEQTPWTQYRFKKGRMIIKGIELICGKPIIFVLR